MDSFDINIVIARYLEDTTWVKQINCNHLYIYDKSGKELSDCSISLNNIGRESHTYLYHIIENYEEMTKTPETITCFSQGNISDHCKDIISIIEDAKKNGISSTNANNHNFQNYSAHYNFRIDEWPNGNKVEPEIENLQFGDWFIKYIEDIFPQPVYWWNGAIFAVKHKYITSRSKKYYINLFNQLTTLNPEVGHYLERAWLYIFKQDINTLVVNNYC